MSETKLETIVRRQLPEAEKRQRADFVVDTNGTIENCHRQIDDLIAKLADWTGDAYDRFWRD
jgi:dephospho-CoA kinase